MAGPPGILGVDISHHNNVPASMMKKNGVQFVIMKSGQEDWEDAAFNGARLENGRRRFTFKDVKKTGMIPGAYHFLTAKNGLGVSTSGAAQARSFVRIVKRANGGNLDNVIMALDDEPLTLWGPRGPKGYRQATLRSNPRWSDVQDFVQEYHRITGGRPLFFYTTASRFRNYKLDQIKGPTRLWLAWWTRTNTNTTARGSATNHGIPASRWDQRFNGRKPTIMQWTNSVKVGRAEIDGNWAMLTKSELLQKANQKGGGPFDGGEGGGGSGTGGKKPKPGDNPFDEKWLDPTQDGPGGAVLSGGMSSIAALGIGGAILAGAGIILLAAIGAQSRAKDG